MYRWQRRCRHGLHSKYGHAKLSCTMRNKFPAAIYGHSLGHFTRVERHSTMRLRFVPVFNQQYSASAVQAMLG